MLYYKTIWNHSNDDFPIVMYSEIDDQRFETKRLEIFRNGKVVYFDSHTPLELGEALYPDNFDEINATDEFDVKEMSAEEFEKILKRYDTDSLIESYFAKFSN